jgi:hypothetical protein
LKYEDVSQFSSIHKQFVTQLIGPLQTRAVVQWWVKSAICHIWWKKSTILKQKTNCFFVFLLCSIVERCPCTTQRTSSAQIFQENGTQVVKKINEVAEKSPQQQLKVT